MGFDEVCISFGGATEETYQKIRGVPMAPIVENIKYLNSLKRSLNKKKPKLSFAIVAMKSIFNDLLDILDIARDIGVEKIEMANIVVQDERLIDESPWLHKEEYLSIMDEFKKKAERYNIELQLFKLENCLEECFHLFSSITITWDGLILSCPMERFIIGNLNEYDIKSIWNHKNYLKLRDRYLKEGLESLCKNCFTWNNSKEAYLYPNKNSRLYAEVI
jgi:radical SAM protein with 4Fe4S-binding SPASM domain